MPKLILKFIFVLIISIALMSLFVGCNKRQTTNKNISSNIQNTTPVSSDKSENINNSDADNITDSGAVNASIVYIRENNSSWMEEQENTVMKAFVNSGYSDIEMINLDGSTAKAYEALAEIKKSKSGVVVVSTDFFAHNIIAKGLKGTSIPVVTTRYVEQLDCYDQDEYPNQNITGIKTFTENIELSGVKLLDYISPIKGKKAVFFNDITTGVFPKKNVEEALKELNIELKDYVVTKTSEDFRNAALKYNNDNEVSWILIGSPPQSSKSNTTENDLTWFAKNCTKPSVTFTESGCSAGSLSALGADPKVIGEQAASMAIRILGGESVNSVQIEQPQSINILINIKTAEKTGINISNDILGSAFKIFTDFQGHFL